MLAVDELALRVAKNDLATALSGTTQWADGTPHPQLGHRRPHRPLR
jgi:hypothetical protein